MGIFQRTIESNTIIKQIVISILAIVLTVFGSIIIESCVDKIPSESEVKNTALEYIKIHATKEYVDFQTESVFRHYPNSNSSEGETWWVWVKGRNEEDNTEKNDELMYIVEINANNGEVLNYIQTNT